MEHTAGDLWSSRVFTQLPDVFVLSASLCSVSVFVYCSLSAAPRVGYRPVQKESLYKETLLTQSSANISLTWRKKKKRRAGQHVCLSTCVSESQRVYTPVSQRSCQQSVHWTGLDDTAG